MKTLFITALAAASVACATEYLTSNTGTTLNQWGGSKGFTLNLTEYTDYTTSPTLTVPTVYLTSLTVVNTTSSTNDDKSAGVALAVYEVGDSGATTYVGLSDIQADATCTQNGSITFTFNELALDTDTTYGFFYVNANADSDALANGSTTLGDVARTWAVRLVKTTTGASSNVYTNDGTSFVGSGWMAKVTLESTDTPASPAVPEPATATLSLLALAGLAARRRRK